MAVSNSRDVREGDSESCSAYLRQIVPQFGKTYANVGVLNPKGTLICSAYTAVPASLADRSYFQRAVAKKDFIVGEYIVGRQTGKAALPLAYPLRTRRRGPVRGVCDKRSDSLAEDSRRRWARTLPSSEPIAMTPLSRSYGRQQMVGQSLKNDRLRRRFARNRRGVQHDEAHKSAFLRASDR